MNKENIQKIKKILLEKRNHLEKDLAKFAKRDVHDKDDYKAIFPNYGDKDDENIAEVATFSDRLSLENTLEKLLRDVNVALERIGEGTYGKCKYCQEEISEERLLARPVSSACVKCKERLKGNQ